jgi:hypothetical protein
LARTVPVAGNRARFAMSNMKIVSMIDAASLATRSRMMADMLDAMTRITSELVTMQDAIAILRRDVDRLKQGGVVPQLNADSA